MMNVQTMRHIVDQIQTGAMPRIAQAAVARWNGNDLAYIRSSANHIFHFIQDGHPRYLRLAHTTERRQRELQGELDFVLHVAAAGLAVARPLASSNGLLIEELVEEGQSYYAIVFDALGGQQFEWDELDEPMYRAWGSTLARLHQTSMTFPSCPARPVLQYQIQSLLKTLPSEEHIVTNVLESGLAWLDTLDIKDYGLLHGDFELDNLIWDGKQFQALDFDAAVYSWYAVDIAAALEDVWLGGGADRDKRLGWFFNGYSQVRPLANNISAMLPHLFNLILAVKVARLLQAYSTTDSANDPEWLMQMRTRHQNWLSAKREILQRSFPA